MFNTSIQNVSSAATIVIGAAFLSVSAMAIASPARADTSSAFRKAVETSISRNMRVPASTATGIVTVSVEVGPDGTIGGATVVQSSGRPALDAEALRTARAVSYPATGKPKTVAMVLGFGRNAGSADTVRGRAIVEAYRNDRRRLLATRTPADPNG